MSWGTVTVGGIAFRETTVAEEGTDGLRLVGQESTPPQTVAAVEAAHSNVLALNGRVVPVTLTDKFSLTGFYRVTDAACTLTREQNGAVETADWSLRLERIGSAGDVEIESRVPTIARTTTVTTPPAAVFWHAPAGGASSYYTGASVPTGSVSRTASDGTVVAYLGIPAGVAPRWTVPAESYLVGSARLLLDGIRRAGTVTPPLTVWELNNGLLQVLPGPSGSFTLSCWDSGAWRSAKSFAVTVAGASLTTTPELTVLRNDPEEVVVRLSYPTTPGRVTVDLGLRRGSRFVTGVIKRHSAATLGLTRTAAETSSVVTGGLRATSADSDGNRFVLGSAVSVTTTTATASIAKASVTAFDFFAGHEVNASPAAGDTFADLWAQYRGSASELTRIVNR